MKVDVDSLGTFNRMANEGAETAARSLSQMTGIETLVNVTKINFIPTSELGESSVEPPSSDSNRTSGEYVGVRIDLEGVPSGDMVVLFERDSVSEVVELLTGTPADELDEMGRSAVQEVGNIITSSFIDGWADVLGTTIDISTPTLVDGSRSEVFSDVIDTYDDEYAVFFESEIDSPETTDTDIGFGVYMFPEQNSMEEAASLVGGDRSIDTSQLVTFNRMTRLGADRVSDHMTQMIGIDTDVEVTYVNFVRLEDVPSEVEEGRKVGLVFEFEGFLGGYILILLDDESAKEITRLLLPSAAENDTDVVDDGFDPTERSAIQEMGNIMTSGFVDAWANVLDATIDISTPKFVHDMGRAIADSITARLGQRQKYSFVFDTRINAQDHEFDCEVYMLPYQDGFEETLQSLNIEEVDRSEIEPDDTDMI
ncbi:chemotaxis protein CheC [Halorutilales archaeon Cl-col2-1]